MKHEDDPNRLDRAMEELRNEPVPQEGKLIMTEALCLPRRHSPAKWIFAGITTALVLEAALLWPQQRALAWSQVVSETLAHTKFHTLSFRPSANGKGWVQVMDQWADGDKYSLDITLPRQSKWIPHRMMNRYDGKRMFLMRSPGNGKEDFGEVNDFKSHYDHTSTADRYSVDQFLRTSGFKAEGDPIKTTLDGVDVLKYVGHTYDRKPIPYAFYADPATKMVVRWDLLDNAGKTLEYGTVKVVDTVPASQFEPPYGQMPVYDEDIYRARLKTAMEHGIAIGGGNVLRAVVKCTDNELMVMWTGTGPNDDGSPRIAIEGYKVVRSYSPIQFGVTSKWARDHTIKYNGENVFVYAFDLDRPAAGKVTLDLPIWTPDKSKPIRGSDGEIFGYATKRAGTKRLTVETILDVPGIIAMDAFMVLSSNHHKGSRA